MTVVGGERKRPGETGDRIKPEVDGVSCEESGRGETGARIKPEVDGVRCEESARIDYGRRSQTAEAEKKGNRRKTRKKGRA